MIQEIAILNFNLEPDIKDIGVNLLNLLAQNDKEIEKLLRVLQTDDVTLFFFN